MSGKLSDNERRLHEAFIGTDDAVFIKDAQRRYVDVNPALLKRMGLKKEQLIGRTPREVFGEEMGSVMEEGDDRTLAGETVRQELTLTYATGTVEVAVVKIPTHDDAGNVVGMFGISRDITELRQVMRVLQEERDRARRYLDVAGVMIVALNPEGKVKLINRTGCEVLGYAQEEILGRSWFETFLPEEEREAVRKVFHALMEGKQKSVEFHENVLVTRDGSRRIFSWHNTTLQDPQGHITGTLASGLDITERKSAEEKLRESEAKYSALVEKAVEGVAIVQDKVIRFANRGLAETLGYSIEELTGMPASRLLDPRDAEWIITSHLDRLAGKKAPSTFETRMVCRDGTLKDVEISSGLIQYRARPASMSVIRDVTERKRVQEKLRQSEQNLRDIFKAASSVSFITTDLKGTEAMITEFSPGAEHIFGYSRKEAVGQPLARLHLPEQVAAFPHVIERMRQSRKPITAEMNLVRKSGETFPALLTTYPIFDSSGEMTGVLGVSIDIAERKRAEEELRQSRDYLHNILNGMHEGILVVDRNLIIRDTNENFAARCHMTRQQLTGQHCHQVMAHRPEPCPNDDSHCPARLVFKTGVPVRLEHRFPAAGTPDQIYDTYAFPLFDREGNVELVVEIQEDVTERMRTEHIRQQGEKLAATGRMAARVAHEINNPLAGIRNAFLLIKDSVPPEHPYFGYVARIESEINRIARIVRNMYDLYSPDQEKSTTFALKEAVDDVVALLAPKCREKAVRLTPQTTSEQARVKLPKGSLFQVLFNVIQNAVEASPREGEVLISADTVPAGIVLSVSDQGPGIPEDVRQHIFEPFFTTKHNHEGAGLGLGLSVSRSLVEAMGGTLDFETRLGKGTTFRVRLPQTCVEREETK